MKKLLVLAITGLTLSSCATMFNGPTKEVIVVSTTPDVVYYINGERVDADSDILKVKLKRGDSHSIIIKKDEHQTKIIEVNSQLQVGWVVWDIINLYPIIVDLPTGSWRTFEKSNFTVELEPNK